MEVREAVASAKSYLTELYREEGILNLGLEEVRFDTEKKVWLVTLGFSRPWERASTLLPPTRSYKVVEVSDGGKVLSVTHRTTASV